MANAAPVAKAPAPSATITGTMMCRTPDGGIMALDDWEAPVARQSADSISQSTPTSKDHDVKSPRDAASGLSTGRSVPDCPKRLPPPAVH